MQFHQPGHIVRQHSRIPQLLQATASQAGAHHLVMVKADPLGSVGASVGLAYVVEQAGQAQHQSRRRLVHHGQAVCQDILVTVTGVLFHLQGGQLGQEVLGQAGSHQAQQGIGGTGSGHQFAEFVPDSLGRHDLETPRHLGHCLQSGRRGPEPQGGPETK